LLGGKGLDTLTGGDGEDTFVIKNFGPKSFDTITDFKPGVDTIELPKTKFKDLSIVPGAGSTGSNPSTEIYDGKKLVAKLLNVESTAISITDFTLKDSPVEESDGVDEDHPDDIDIGPGHEEEGGINGGHGSSGGGGGGGFGGFGGAGAGGGGAGGWGGSGGGAGGVEETILENGPLSGDVEVIEIQPIV